jgi:tripartite-type tricarboxylate transporter receptor subunit TctC
MPDGYTLLAGNIGTHGINPAVYPSLIYDPIADFSPIILTSEQPAYLVVSPQIKATTLREFIKYAAQNPNKLSYASLGIGSFAHLVFEWIKGITGISIVHVPYRGSTQMLPDLMAGRIDVGLDASALPLIKQNQLTVLAVSASDRLPSLPDTPTVSETLPDVVAVGRFGLFVPSRTPDKIIEKLNVAFGSALADETVRSKLADLGVLPLGGSPEKLAAHLNSEIKKWGKITKAANIR